jgi:hypothetical protein
VGRGRGAWPAGGSGTRTREGASRAVRASGGVGARPTAGGPERRPPGQADKTTVKSAVRVRRLTDNEPTASELGRTPDC